MTDAHLDIKDLIIDCADPERLASFWGRLLGRPITTRIGPYVWLERQNGLGMGFQQAGEPKAEASSSWPTRRATSSASSPGIRLSSMTKGAPAT
jgi:hypothetical protein